MALVDPRMTADALFALPPIDQHMQLVGGNVDVADGAPLQTKLLAALGRTG